VRPSSSASLARQNRADKFAVLFNLFVCERAERIEEYSSCSFVGLAWLRQVRFEGKRQTNYLADIECSEKFPREDVVLDLKMFNSAPPELVRAGG
jgi:hypothetical protein